MFDFGTSGLLRGSDLVMYDRETQSWWQQFFGEALVGDMVGTTLEILPSSHISWAQFKELYPEGMVLSRNLDSGRAYGETPYTYYEYGSGPISDFWDGGTDARLTSFERVSAVTIGNADVAYPFSVLKEVGVVNDVIGDTPITVFFNEHVLSVNDEEFIADSRQVGSTGVFQANLDGKNLTFMLDNGRISDEETGSIWNIQGLSIGGPLEGIQLSPVSHFDSYWFAWAVHKPDTRIYRSGSVASGTAPGPTLGIPTQTPPPHILQGRIIFSSFRDNSDLEIYVMDADGSNQTRLTNRRGVDRHGSWSPDGKKIAFFSLRDVNSEIYVMNADGSSETNITRTAATEQDPSWSPVGDKIAFTSWRRGEGWEIYVIDADGSNRRRLTFDNDSPDQSPAWSSDGSKIVFASKRDGNWEIYSMDADGSNQTRITNNSGDDTNPAWSPAGRKIAFASKRDRNWEIYVMDADGSNQVRLTAHRSMDRHPVWSPDGGKIAFTSGRGGDKIFKIYVMNADGSNQAAIIQGQTDDQEPDWTFAVAP